MKLNPYTKAALACLFVGIGVALFASAVSDVRAARPCVGCDEDEEKTATEVAEASAEMTEPTGDAD